MLKRFFGRSSQGGQTQDMPSILGFRVGCSFELDPLMLRMRVPELLIESCAPTQIIEAAGAVTLDQNTRLFRFYTDDDAFVQVVAEGGQNDEHVVDVKLFHFYDTLDINTQAEWDRQLNQVIGAPSYTLDGTRFERVWTSASDYHMPVHMEEKTHVEGEPVSSTDQFTMLFERPIADGETESLFLSAEEKQEKSGHLSRCLVQSTGMTLTPAQIKIHG